MDHKFKNEQINKILSDHENYNIAAESADSMEKAAEIMRKLSTEELGNAILGGYYSSLVEVAGWNDVFPDIKALRLIQFNYSSADFAA